MNTKMFNSICEYYKKHYQEIEKKELYKWEAVSHFQMHWDIDSEHFPDMLEESLRKTQNLMSAGKYYPRKMIVWAAKKEPETLRELFRMLYDLSGDLKERIELFRAGIDEVVEKHREEKISRSYQDHRAIMVYLNMRYPEKYYLYKYKMFADYARLIDYGELPKAGELDLLFMFESMCNMILNRVMQDRELLTLYESRRRKYYDPEYHLLVQDIIYAAKYFENPEIIEEKKTVFVKQFSMNAEKYKPSLQGVHVDHIEKAKRQKEIGDAGEEFVYQYERKQVKSFHLKKNLQVRRVSQLDGDGLGYDILSYDQCGNEKYIEVKTTSGPEDESIFITAHELKKSEEAPDQYYLYRVYDFNRTEREGKISIRRGSLKELCISPQIYKVNFK